MRILPDGLMHYSHAWTDRQVADFHAWLRERPPVIQALVETHPPGTCYRGAEDEDGHYMIWSYSELGTITVLHGADSFSPRTRVFGILPSDLVPCACGQWRAAAPRGYEV